MGHTHAHTHTHTHTHTRTHAPTHPRTHACMHACPRMHACRHARTHARTHRLYRCNGTPKHPPQTGHHDWMYWIAWKTQFSFKFQITSHVLTSAELVLSFAYCSRAARVQHEMVFVTCFFFARQLYFSFYLQFLAGTWSSNYLQQWFTSFLPNPILNA